MKIIQIVLFWLFSCQHLSAQQNHFIYIESDTRKPFYARLNQKAYTSSDAGYLIIPKLSAGQVRMIIGFPKNEWPAQTFSVKLDKDAGFLLKQSLDGRFSLYNMQSFEELSSIKPDSQVVQAIIPVPDTISVKLPLEKDSLKTDSAAVLKDSVVVVPVHQPVRLTDSVMGTANPVMLPQVVTKLQQAVLAGGLSVIYLVNNGTANDTIDLFLAQDISAPPDTANDASRQGVDEMKQPLPASPVQPEKPVIRQIQTTDPVQLPVQSVLPAHCKKLAGMDEFLRLRKNMAAQKTEEAMTRAAKKFLQTMCIKTEQARNLAALYLNDEGRYGFFDACYPHISDPAAFPALENQLTDTYYINRFRAMLR